MAVEEDREWSLAGENGARDMNLRAQHSVISSGTMSSIKTQRGGAYRCRDVDVGVLLLLLGLAAERPRGLGRPHGYPAVPLLLLQEGPFVGRELRAQNAPQSGVRSLRRADGGPWQEDGVLTTAGRVLPSASSRAGPAHPCVKASSGKRK